MRIGYYFGEAFQGIRRNALMTISAILTVAISLMLFGSVLLIREWTDTLVGRWRGNVEINLFLRTDASEPQIEAIQAKIASMPEISEYRYVSRDEALEEFRQMFKDKKELVENVDPSILPPSFRIKLRNPEEVDVVADQLNGLPGVDEVQTASETIKKLARITNILTVGMGVFVAVFGLAAVLLIANSIRLALFARRMEIGIMKLVGATNWFVRVPFMIEGMITGIVGSAIAALAVWGLTAALARVKSYTPLLDAAVGPGTALQVAVLVSILGVAVGALGSAIALRRFLDV
jgi:cell division transport system permease protein